MKAWFQLVRLPNVFTAPADVLMGWFFMSAAWNEPSLAALLAASVGLYMAGMVLNDAFDVDVDTRERRTRPIPSGQVTLAQARMFGWGLLAIGLACGWLAAMLANTPRPGWVATALAGAIIAYDAWLKRTPLGPLAMGACRSLNVLLGMSAAVAAWGAPHGVVAGGLGLYVAGFTLFARREAGTSDVRLLAAALGVMIAGLVLVASLPMALPADQPTTLAREPWWLLMLIVAGPPLGRCLQAILSPTPALVQAAVKRSILSLVFLDAAVCVLVRGVEPAVVIVALVFPMLYFGRWLYST